MAMKIWALISQKGGSGKTTLALNLAIAAANARKQVVLIDLDPQQSAARWARLRQDDMPVIVSGHAPNLNQLIENARGAGASLVVIDTQPKSESAALDVAKIADVVFVPCQASGLDLDAVSDTVNIIKLAGSPASAFVINGARSSSSLADQAMEALAEYRLSISPVRIGSRVAFVKSLAAGKGVVEYEPSGPSAKEINELYKYAIKLGGKL